MLAASPFNPADSPPSMPPGAPSLSSSMEESYAECYVACCLGCFAGCYAECFVVTYLRDMLICHAELARLPELDLRALIYLTLSASNLLAYLELS